MFDEEVSATFPIAGGDIFDLRRISSTLTDGLQRFQQDPMTIGPVLTVFLARDDMITIFVYNVPATRTLLTNILHHGWRCQSKD